MRNHHFSGGQSSKQSGVVMFVALILLLILSLLGVTASRMQTVEERMARNDNNRQLGAQAAEAALRAAEAGILSGTISDFVAGTGGLYTPDLTQGSPLTGMDWTVAVNTLPYPGPALADLPAPSRTPKIVIEQLNSVAGAGQNIQVVGLNGPPPVSVFRVTAQGVGADGTSTTMLQTIVR
ncbi:MAG TPA: PilX N-terminal domain-containing pilus assembly protein [Steroidobacteraceae bacterium]|jgi:type IV pilus assembly protein PilX|nr:PilX N-terminal domain-containing pilus assembly protein [Steroidobacteraceae bacterium]